MLLTEAEVPDPIRKLILLILGLALLIGLILLAVDVIGGAGMFQHYPRYERIP